MSTSTGRPRPFLEGVYRTACNYCVRSKRGCSGGNPCEQCLKRGKTCTYAQRRMSGPRGRPSGHSHRVRSRARARRQQRAEALKSACEAAALVPEQPEPAPTVPRHVVRSLRAQAADAGFSSGSEYTPSDGWDSDIDNPIVALPSASAGSEAASRKASLGSNGAGDTSDMLTARRGKRPSLSSSLPFAHISGYDSDMEIKLDAVVPDETFPGLPDTIQTAPTVPSLVSADSYTVTAPRLQRFVTPILSSSSSGSEIKTQSAPSCRQPLPPVPVPGASMLAEAGVYIQPAKRTRVISTNSTEMAPNALSAQVSIESVTSKEEIPLPKYLYSPSLVPAPKPSAPTPSAAASGLPSLVPFDEFESGAQRHAALVDWRSGDSAELQSHAVAGVGLEQEQQAEVISPIPTQHDWTEKIDSVGAMVQALENVARAPQAMVQETEVQQASRTVVQAPRVVVQAPRVVAQAPRVVAQAPQAVAQASTPTPQTAAQAPQVVVAQGPSQPVAYVPQASAQALQAGTEVQALGQALQTSPHVAVQGHHEGAPYPSAQGLHQHQAVGNTGVVGQGGIASALPASPFLCETVSAGTDLWEEFVDLESATTAAMAPLTREGSLMRVMEVIGAEMTVPPSVCDPSLFAEIW